MKLLRSDTLGTQKTQIRPLELPDQNLLVPINLPLWTMTKKDLSYQCHLWWRSWSIFNLQWKIIYRCREWKESKERGNVCVCVCVCRYLMRHSSRPRVPSHYLFRWREDRACAHCNLKLWMTAPDSKCIDLKGNLSEDWVFILCVLTSMQRRRMFGRHPAKKRTSSLMKRVADGSLLCAEGMIIGHYITESLLSSLWEGLTA